jgi:predicted alpha-1,2-mannosidase
VASLHRAAEQGGWLPRWPLVAADTGVMNGDSAAPMVAAAYAFGARAFPLRRVVDQLVRQAQVPGPPGPGGLPRPGLEEYLRFGYVPNTTPEPGWPEPHGASTTLEYAVDDFAVARLAAAAGRPGVAARLHERSASWRSLLDPERGLLLPRDAEGDFPPADHDPAGCCDGFQEGNALQYTWSGVPHDMAGLLAGLGGPDQVIDRLRDFHEHLNTGAGDPHAWLGNQPSFPTPWAYHWVGRPGLAQEVVDRARNGLWSLTPEGLAGNDDLGSMSAWYVWASLGLYPLTPGTANLGLGVPAFDEAVVTPSAGTATRIIRVGSAGYVGSVRVDGALRTESWLPFEPAARPRRIVVATTPTESPTWGTGGSDRPPSYPAG